MYRCVSDLYDPNGDIPYDSLEDFLAMCQECFGEQPTLRETFAGDYEDTDGTLVLQVLDDESDDYDDGEAMDGDHDSAMASCGWGTDEDYGCYNSGDDDW